MLAQRTLVTLSVLSLTGACTTGPSSTSGTTGDGGVGPTNSESCTKQPEQLRLANCDTTKNLELWSCAANAAPPSAECGRTTLENSYCCPGAPPKALAIIRAQVDGQHEECTGYVDLSVGAFPDTRVEDGSAQVGGLASVACTVSATSAGFTVASQVKAPTGPTFSLSGVLRSSDPAGTVTVVVTGPGGSKISRQCAATYSDVAPRIAAGRVWIRFACAPVMDAVQTPDVCDLHGEVRLENCATK